MKFENIEVWGFEHALRGMRNPLESWDKSDSYYFDMESYDAFDYIIGENDLSLAQRLIKCGTEHRKFLRQIMVSVDITAPLYVWKEFDTYKIGTTANSTSTMHKLSTTPITIDCFETDGMDIYLSWENANSICTIGGEFGNIIKTLEELRQAYIKTKDKRYWKELIRWLPESWLQTRTVTMNYENLRNMYFQRRNHKLTEWSVAFCDFIKSLPYAEELICYEPKEV